MKATDDTSPFGDQTTTSSDQGTTRTERYQQTLNEWVYAPLVICWKDWRARVGALIILFYILLGTIGVVIIPEPTPYIAPNLVMPFQYAEAPLGTDNLGRSVAHQAVHATPAMLQMITAGAVFSTAVATAVGTAQVINQELLTVY
ncbi:hypothetical protein ACFFQF_31955 [Haladaptatus pallidirubidus]|uniref:hypothetical protein n=1 Tax=Haladaptatus pallidirubidus TaxID=1008152 RepID=UPI0035EC7EB4